MDDDYRTVVGNSINLVLGNIEESYFWIRRLLKECDSAAELAACIQDYYEECIESVTMDSSSVGAFLVRELCFGIPSSVFEVIATDYWNEYNNDGSDNVA